MTRLTSASATPETVSSTSKNPGDLRPRRHTIALGRVVLKSSKQDATFIQVNCAGHSMGRVDMTEVSDVEAWTTHPLKAFKHGQFVKCAVLRSTSKKLELSLRPSVLEAVQQGESLEGLEQDIQEGLVVKGFVCSTTKSGVFVKLSRNRTGRVMLKHLSDRFVEDVPTAFPIGMLVAGRVLKIHSKNKNIDLSLKPTTVLGDSMHKWSMSNIQVGMRMDGRVRKVVHYGVFVDLEDSRLSGLCHISEASEGHVKDLNKLFSSGDLVRVVVLKIEDKKLSFGLKPSYFEDEQEGGESSQEQEQANEAEESEGEEEEEIQDKESSLEDQSEEEKEEEEEAASSSDEDLAQHDEESKQQPPKKKMKVGNSLSLSEAMALVSAAVEEEEEVMDASDAEEDAPSTKRKRKRRNKERDVAEQESTAFTHTNDIPQTDDDFEMRLLANSDSSQLWIQFMAFRVGQSDLTGARSLAHRALSEINYRREEEKMNVWIALLNLESKYGSAESLEKVFKRMVTRCDAKQAYLSLYQVFVRADNLDEALNTLKKARKVTKQTSAQVWLKILELHFQYTRDLDAARAALQEALRFLPIRKHISVLMSFARMEFKFGNKDRARTVMETLIQNHPKKTDLWNVFIDMECKLCQSSVHARKLFQRVVSVKMSPKKMKAFFKKWLLFENGELGGGEEAQEEVKAHARAYVESLEARSDEESVGEE